MPTFSYVPDYGAEGEVTTNVRATKFGDGYEQRQANGINSVSDRWPLTFSLRTDTEASAIVAFLATQGGVTSFDWTTPDGVAGKYVCRSWRRRKDRYNLNTVTCTLERVFEP